MENHPKKEQTYIMVKPDGVQRGLVGEIISRIERTGLKIVALKMFVADKEKLVEHYGKTDEWYESKGKIIVENRTTAGLPIEKTAHEYGKGIIDALVNYMSSGPVAAMVVEGNQSVAIVKKLVGGTEPTTSDVGTIRGDLTLDSYHLANLDSRAVRNLIHCSDQVDEAIREIGLWMSSEDMQEYRTVHEAMLYDVNMDGVQE